MAGRRYKRGMADASRAYQAFGQKQEDALRHILNEVQSGRKEISDALGELDANFDNLYDRLDASEKEKLYSVSMPFDLKTLDEYEKMFLVGALFALAEDCHPTENQQKYILTLKKYLEIPEPPKEPVDPLNIENVDSVEAQKAIYQVVLEYLSLQDEECFDVTDLQTDFLDSFNLSPKIRRAITARVNFLYDVTGTAGLVEKYGFVNQEEIRSKETEELNRIREAEHRENIATEVLNKVVSHIQGSTTFSGAYEICAETDNYILLGRKNKVTNEDYIIIDKRTADETFVGDIFNQVWPSSFVSGEDTVLICDEYGYVHIIDLEQRNAKRTEMTIKNSDELLAVGNERIVAYKDGKLIIYNVTDGNVIELENNGGISKRKAIITAKGFYFSSQYSPLQYYDFETKEFLVVYEPEDSKKIHHIQYFNGTIYIMLIADVEYGCGKYDIISIDCQNDEMDKKVLATGYVYSQGRGIIKKCADGWCFIEEESITNYRGSPKFLFSYFDMASNEKSVLTSNFGRYDWVKTGLLSKKDIYRETQDYNVVGTKILYHYRTSTLTFEYRYLDIHKPANVVSISSKK